MNKTMLFVTIRVEYSVNVLHYTTNSFTRTINKPEGVKEGLGDTPINKSEGVKEGLGDTPINKT